jgi:hypothetical protein
LQQACIKRRLRQRIIALAAAYAIALAGLIGSFAAAQTAAAAAAQPGGIICHTDLTGQSAPSTGGNGGTTCIGDCCTGCLTPIAALPPPAQAIAMPLASSEQMVPSELTVLSSRFPTKSYSSRAPPLTA